jgi:uncharacterized protein (DUF58 family)
LPLPTIRTVGLTALGVIPAVLWQWEGALMWNLGLLCLWGADLLLAPRGGVIRVRRVCAQHLSQGIPAEVEIHLRNDGGRRSLVAVRDQTPPEWKAAPVMVAGLAPRSETTLRYGISPPRRGTYCFGEVWIRARGPLGLAMTPAAGGICRDTVRVYPPLRPHGRADLAAYRRTARSRGLRPSRWREAGWEFESLREYVDGDDPRKIHWKATARFDRPIVQQQQAQRNQIVMIMLDAGRLMAAVSQGRSKLDHALEAAVHLTHAALWGGDRVGLLAFSNEVLSYVPPRRSRDQLRRILDSVGDLEPRMVEPRYEAAVMSLRARLRRRSLVVIFTDLLDEVASEALLSSVGLLRPRHLPLCVAVGESEWSEMMASPPQRAVEVYRRVALYALMRQRGRALAGLIRKGALAVDVPPAALTPATIERYLEVKRRGLL